MDERELPRFEGEDVGFPAGIAEHQPLTLSSLQSALAALVGRVTYEHVLPTPFDFTRYGYRTNPFNPLGPDRPYPGALRPILRDVTDYRLCETEAPP